MKKLLFLVFIAASQQLTAQSALDTVYPRNIILRYDEVKAFVGGITFSDSLDLVYNFPRIKAAVDAAGNLTASTNITIDSLRGAFVLRIYAFGQSLPRGLARTLPNNGNNYRTTIRNYTPIVPYCDVIDAGWDAQIEQQMKFGKFKLNKSN